MTYSYRESPYHCTVYIIIIIIMHGTSVLILSNWSPISSYTYSYCANSRLVMKRISYDTQPNVVLCMHHNTKEQTSMQGPTLLKIHSTAHAIKGFTHVYIQHIQHFKSSAQEAARVSSVHTNASACPAGRIYVRSHLRCNTALHPL